MHFKSFFGFVLDIVIFIISHFNRKFFLLKLLHISNIHINVESILVHLCSVQYGIISYWFTHWLLKVFLDIDDVFGLDSVGVLFHQVIFDEFVLLLLFKGVDDFLGGWELKFVFGLFTWIFVAERFYVLALFLLLLLLKLLQFNRRLSLQHMLPNHFAALSHIQFTLPIQFIYTLINFADLQFIIWF